MKDTSSIKNCSFGRILLDLLSCGAQDTYRRASLNEVAKIRIAETVGTGF
jgi:hypothetical protein